MADLGISHLYASPIFKARRGSSHGYDVVNPKELNPELGTRKEFEELTQKLKVYGLRWIQDFTPNHMAYDYQNRMLMDVLEHGRRSKYFEFFDIEWNHPCEKIHGKLLAPFLTNGLEETLEEGKIRLNYGKSGFTVDYHDLKFPLKMESYPTIMGDMLDEVQTKLGNAHPDYRCFLEILSVLDNLSYDPNKRKDQANLIKETLWELYHTNAEIKLSLEESIEALNEEKVKPESCASLEELLSRQLFTLSFWKTANEMINYRRFFTINFLICLRMEEEEVFQCTHSKLFEFLKQGKVDGLRIDHIDGLHDPTEYLQKLREVTEDHYIIVEKILDLKENLPPFWPVQGTTGYKFLNYVNGIFILSESQREFDDLYSRFSGLGKTFKELLYQKRKFIIDRYLMGDLNNLTRSLHRILKKRIKRREITFRRLRDGLIEVMSLIPVYRTYISPEESSPEDQRLLRQTMKKVERKNPRLTFELNLIQETLLGKPESDFDAKENEQRLKWVMRWQQFTGPIMAKGLEDTALYIYNRLLSLNEVGGNPERFGISLKEFHAFNERRAELHPLSLNTTSTHDTKRGGDVRARINVLSEIPKEWKDRIQKWTQLNHEKKSKVGGKEAPDKNEEYLLYQTLLGAFPYNIEEGHSEFLKRIKSYMVKVLREAKIHSSWLEPNLEYEEAVTSFVKEILHPSIENPFLKDFHSFQKKISHYGVFNSLSQTILKITCPGVPDFYQGTETWDLNLVDPDNRRPVNFEKRKKLLQDIKRSTEEGLSSSIAELLSNPEDGKVKLFLILEALKTRKRNIQLFQEGSYIPLEVEGKLKEHIIVFARHYQGKWAITIAPRFLTSIINENQNPLGPVWEDTEVRLPQEAPSTWENTITNELIRSDGTISVGKILQKFPVALLISEKD